MSSQSNTITKLGTIDELSKILSVSKITIYRLVETRKIPFYKIKGCIRFAETDILKFLEQSRIDEMDKNI